MVNVEAIHLPFPQMIKIFSVKSAKNNIFIEKKSLDSIVSNQIRLDVTGSGNTYEEWTILHVASAPDTSQALPIYTTR